MTTRLSSATVTLPTPTQILITRQFDAPAALLYEAFTTPEHVRRWWGFESQPLTVCEIDLRVGGTWRYVTRTAEGMELGWHGEYLELEPPYRTVSTEVFEGFPDAQSVNTMTLTEEGGITTLRTLVQHTSQEHRDGHINSGMEGGMQHTFNRLQRLLVQLAPASDAVADRYRKVAARFGEVVATVPADAWERPAPCEGWVARDVVRHLTEWVPPFMKDGAGVEIASGPSVDEDPVAAWAAVDESLQALLDDPASADRVFAHPRAGTHPLPQAIGMFIMGDLLVHTWDLARATGQPEALDPTEVHNMRTGLEPLGDMLEKSGQYGKITPVPDGADEQTVLLALTGRTA